MVSIFSGYPGFLDAELEGGKIYFIKIEGVLKGLIGIWPESGIQLLPVQPGTDDWKQLKPWLAKSYEVYASSRSQEWVEQHHRSVVNKKRKALPKWNQWEGRPVHKKEYGVSKFE